jgi:hypothetical protein
MRNSLVRVCFDTSALNRLFRDPERKVLLATLIAKTEFWISAYNVLEAAKTADIAVRHGLVRMMWRLAAGKPPLKPPHALVRAVARAYAAAGLAGRPKFAEKEDSELAALWRALNNPGLLGAEARAEAVSWATNWEGEYDDIVAGARERFQALYSAAPSGRPRTAAGTLRGYMTNDDQIFSRLVAPIYEQETGKSLSRSDYDLMMTEPVWCLSLGGYGYAVHHRSVKAEGFSKTRNAGGIDLGQAVYLRLVDQFVTNDRAQYRGLRFLSRFARGSEYDAEVVMYDAFRKRLLPSE